MESKRIRALLLKGEVRILDWNKRAKRVGLATMRYVLFLLIVFNSWSFARGSGFDVHSVQPDSALAQALQKLEGDGILLDEVVRLALEKSTLAIDAREALASARGLLNRERGGFDPRLYGELSSSSSKQPSSSPFSGAAVLNPKSTSGEVGARNYNTYWN
jgi:hypothetical protein